MPSVCRKNNMVGGGEGPTRCEKRRAFPPTLPDLHLSEEALSAMHNAHAATTCTTSV